MKHRAKKEISLWDVTFISKTQNSPPVLQLTQFKKIDTNLNWLAVWELQSKN